jgi:hypothetical protein
MQFCLLDKKMAPKSMLLFISVIMSMFICLTHGGVLVEVPYYKCLRNDEPIVPGVCASFQTHFLVIDIVEPFTDSDALQLCQSVDAQGMFTSMADAISDWSTYGCVFYLMYYIEPELRAIQYETNNKAAAVSKAEVEAIRSNLMRELDEIQELYRHRSNIMEGSIWRIGIDDSDSVREELYRKRNCLLGTLISGLPENAHIGEVVGDIL